ncbi:MAG: transglutaminase family protein [Congregibacter sp.]
MTTLTIHHRTTYHYAKTITFGSHRLMLRPRESRKLRLLKHELSCSPSASTSWAQDVRGNAVATTTFREPSDILIIDSYAEVILDTEQWPVFDIAASAANYPFLLSDDDMTDLGALRLQSYLDSSGALSSWAKGFIAGNPTDTLALLKDLSAGVAAQITYEVREEENTQSPQETLARGRGSCRDLSALFVDAVRCLGFGARMVSGYLFDPDLSAIGSSGSGSTHAWAEVYVPGAGWITFDPTNRSVGGHNLIPVAVARHISQTIPVAGSFVGDPSVFKGMEVVVQVGPAA